MWERVKRLERINQGAWLKLIIGSSGLLLVLSLIQFILSRFNAGTMELEMKMMRGMFLSMFIKDVLNVAIQGVILFLLLGAGVGMFVYIRRISGYKQ